MAKSRKRSSKNLTKKVGEEFAVKNAKGAVFIEGFANKATVDRGQEVIATDAWELDNFKKNPVILFNHGFDHLGGTPVGKATEITPTEKGLFIKVRLSNSKTPGIQMVRDLVEERILKAFSVGFDPKETDSVEIEGQSIRKITKAELFEVSIVGIPMNQDSTFELTEKDLKTKSLHQIKSKFLKSKGATKALEIEDMFVDADDRLEVIEKVATELDVEVLTVKDMLAGDVELTDEVEAAFKEQLAPSASEAEMLQAALKRIEDGEDAAQVMKELQEQWQAKASDGDEEEDEEDDEEAKKDFQDCVDSKVPALIDEGKERDEAVAQAIAMCQEEGKCALTPEGKTAAYRDVFDAVDAWDGKSDFSVELSDDVKFAKKQVDEGDQGDQAPSQPIATEKNDDDFGSPYLDAQKQANVMLGTLVGEIQGLRADLQKIVQPAEERGKDDPIDGEEGDDEDDPDSDSSKASVDYAQKTLETLDKRLKNLGC